MMSPSERTQWLQQRKTGIGGSEIGALLSHVLPEVKYGCRRQLWYRKSQVTPDREEEESAPMRLGSIMEPPLRALYAGVTGYKVEEPGRMVHPQIPEMGVSLDGLIHAPNKPSPGVLETKNLGVRNFYAAKRDGLPPEYLLQANHGMLIASAALGLDIRWGAMVVGRSDDPRMIARTLDYHMGEEIKHEINPSYMLYWEIERDDKICDAILREVPAFWKTVGDPNQIPERLEIDDPRCGRCAWSTQCHGGAVYPTDESISVMPELAPLAKEYLERQAVLKEAEESVQETKEIIQLLLGDKQAVQVPVDGKLRPIYWRPQEGKIAYGESFKNMAAQYNILRDRLIQIEQAIRETDVYDGLKTLAAGAELVPVPSSFVKKGKGSRPLLLSYLSPKVKKEDE